MCNRGCLAKSASARRGGRSPDDARLVVAVEDLVDVDKNLGSVVAQRGRVRRGGRLLLVAARGGSLLKPQARRIRVSLGGNLLANR